MSERKRSLVSADTDTDLETETETDTVVTTGKKKKTTHDTFDLGTNLSMVSTESVVHESQELPVKSKLTDKNKLKKIVNSPSVQRWSADVQ